MRLHARVVAPVVLAAWLGPASGAAQSVGPMASQPPTPDWTALEAETLEHFQALLRLDTSNPPGNETLVVDYLATVLEREGIAVETYALEPDRANLVARLPGSGAKRPLLLMGHTDVVSVDPSKWAHPPFAAEREGGYIYGRGALDDKDNVVTSLMVMLTLKRLGVALDRDVIFLAEAGEEGTTRPGIDFMVEQHFSAIDAEYCLAEGGGVARQRGAVQPGRVGTLEKIPRTVQLRATGPSGHASVPLQGNAVTRLANAISAVSTWEFPVRLNETTREFFRRLEPLSSSQDAEHLRGLVSDVPDEVSRAVAYFAETTPAYVAMVRNSISPTVMSAGFRYNVIPSDATATLDVRALPDENPEDLLAQLREVINDPSVEVSLAPRDGMQRPAGATSIDTDAFRAIEAAMEAHYGTVALPVMGTGATDKAQMRARGVQCYGIGPLTDVEDGQLGFAAHGDQERILEEELHRFLRFTWDIVATLAVAR